MSKVTVAPVVERLRSRFFQRKGDHGRSAHARRTWQIAPAEAYETAPAVFDERTLSRVTGFGDDTSMAIERARIAGGLREHRATTAYLMENVVVLRGHLFMSGWVERIANTPAPFIDRQPELRYYEAVLVSTLYGRKFFGHWIADDLPLALAGLEFTNPLQVSTAEYPHEKVYLNLLSLNIDRTSFAAIDRLTILDDAAQNSYKRRRFGEIRSRLRRDATLRRDGRSVFLMRKLTGTGKPRYLSNELELAERLTAMGFSALCAEEHSPEEIRDICLDARVVVGVEGSHLAHALLNIRDGGSLIALQPPFQFNNVFKDYCDCIGLRYGFVIGHQDSSRSFHVDPGDLLRVLDFVL